MRAWKWRIALVVLAMLAGALVCVDRARLAGERRALVEHPESAPSSAGLARAPGLSIHDITDAGSRALDGSALGPCRSIAVLDADGRPARDALLLFGVSGEPPAELRTDSTGHAHVCAPPGELTIDAWDADGRWASHHLSWETAVEPLELVVVEPASLEGVVVDGLGAPIAGALLAPQWHEPDQPHRGLVRTWEAQRLSGSAQWTSGTDGRFSIPIQRGGLIELHVEADGFAETEAGPFAMGYGATTEVRVVLASGGAAEGIVTYEGAPLAGAEVRALRIARQTRTGADGRFRLAGLGLDLAYPVAVDAPGFVFQMREVRAGETHRFDLERAVLTRVRMRPPREMRSCPWEDPPAYIAFESGMIRLLEWDEWRELTVLPPGTHEVRAMPHRLGDDAAAARALAATRTFTAVAGETTELDVQLILPDGEGVVELTVGGAPADVLAQVVATLAPQSGAGISLTPRGARACAHAPSGRYELVARAAGWRASAELDVAPGTRHVLELALRPAPDQAGNCCPAFATSIVEDALLVSRVAPGAPVVGGERIVGVDGAHGAAAQLARALCAAGARPLRLELDGLDGRRRAEVVPRSCAPEPLP